MTWTCGQCTLQNNDRRRRCEVCQARKPVAIVKQWVRRRKRKRKETESPRNEKDAVSAGGDSSEALLDNTVRNQLPNGKKQKEMSPLQERDQMDHPLAVAPTISATGATTMQDLDVATVTAPKETEKNNEDFVAAKPLEGGESQTIQRNVETQNTSVQIEIVMDQQGCNHQDTGNKRNEPMSIVTVSDEIANDNVAQTPDEGMVESRAIQQDEEQVNDTVQTDVVDKQGCNNQNTEPPSIRKEHEDGVTDESIADPLHTQDVGDLTPAKESCTLRTQEFSAPSQETPSSISEQSEVPSQSRSTQEMDEEMPTDHDGKEPFNSDKTEYSGDPCVEDTGGQPSKTPQRSDVPSFFYTPASQEGLTQSPEKASPEASPESPPIARAIDWKTPVATTTRDKTAFVTPASTTVVRPAILTPFPTTAKSSRPARVSFCPTDNVRTIPRPATDDKVRNPSMEATTPLAQTATHRVPTLFHSAGGASIQVSTESLAKAESLLSHSKSLESQSVTPTLFQSAGGRAINVSTENLAKAKSLLSDEDAKRCPSAFSTGQGKPIVVSSDSLSGAQDLMEGNKASTERAVCPQGVKLVATAQAPPVSFSTGRGNSIPVSSASLSRARSLMAGTSDTETKKPSPLGESKVSSVSFASAGLGKAIQVSANNLSRARKLMGSKSEATRDNSEVPRPSLFSSASGKSIEVSSESLSKAKTILSASSESSLSQAPLDLRNVDAKKEEAVEFGAQPEPKCPAFVSAGLCKKVEVSKERLLQASKLLAGRCFQPRNVASTAVSFSSAGRGKKIVVSEESMATASQLMLGSTATNSTSSLKDTSVASFSSAGLGKKIEVSSEGLDQAKKLLAATKQADDCNASLSKVSEPMSVSFSSTGLNKKIEVSTESLAKAAALMLSSMTNDPHENTGSAHLPANVLNEASQSATTTSSHSLNRDRTCFQSVDIRELDPSPVTAVAFPHYKDCPRNEDENESLAVDSMCDGVAVTDNMSIPEIHQPQPKDSPLLHSIRSDNGIQLRFCSTTKRAKCFVSSSGDDDDTLVGTVEDYERVLLEEGYSPDRVSRKWLSNHINRVIWKLAGLERHFPTHHVCSFTRVVAELKKRFAVELVRGSRSSLRVILNRDVAASKLMIVMVSKTVLIDGKDFFIEVTDGWYSVRARIDSRMREMIESGTVRSGTKLVVSCAYLAGCDDGIDPLDEDYDTTNLESSPELCFSTNGSRIAKWSAKLGFVRNDYVLREHEGYLTGSRLASLFADGGTVPLLDATVAEPCVKLFLLRNPDNSGSSVMTEAEEEKRQQEYEKRKQSLVEKFTAEIQNECLEDIDEHAPDVWKAMCRSGRTEDDFFLGLSESDRSSLAAWREKRALMLSSRMAGELEAKLEEEGEEEQVASPFLRLVVCDSEGAKATLTVWSPTEDLQQALKVEASVRLFHINLRANFNGLPQLVANRSSRIVVRGDVVASVKLQTEPTGPLPLVQVAIQALRNKAEFVADIEALTLHISEGQAMLADCNGLRMTLHDVPLKVPLNATVKFHRITVETFCPVKRELVAHFGEPSSWRLVKRDVQFPCRQKLIPTTSSEPLCIIGYVAGLELLPSKELLLLVDTGCMTAVRLPLTKLGDFECSTDTFLDENTELQVERLHGIGNILKSRRDLYAFGIKTTPENDAPEIDSVALADTKALSALYSSILA